MKTIFFKSKTIRWAMLLGIATVFTYCDKDRDKEFTTEAVEETKTVIQQEHALEEAHPNTTGKLIDISLEGQSVTVEDFNDHYIMEGDIMIDPNSLNQGAKSVGRTRGFWPNCTVYYNIESSLPNKGRVTSAIAHWEQYSNLRFVKRTNQTAYVNFKSGSGCSSYVGRQGNKQDIILAAGCSVGSTIHEIGHAIGLYHEQSRKDRNNFINVNLANVTAGKTHNFQTYVQRRRDGNEYSPSLDFSSIMMYGPYAFSKNGLPTITKKNGSTYTTQRNGLSIWDRIGASKMYPYKSCGTSDCLNFNPSKLYAKKSGSVYIITDGVRSMISAPNLSEANRIIAILKRYGYTKTCYVGRPNPEFQYQLVGYSPSNVTPASWEDIIRFNPKNLDVQKIGGRWKIVDGSRLIFDFGSSQADARKALCFILRYKYTGTGYVGRPGASFQYMVK